jgi:predicted deacylase
MIPPSRRPVRRVARALAAFIAISSAMAGLLCASPALAQGPFSIAGATAVPGSVASGTLQVPPGAADAGTSIPFSIVHGTKPGPVLMLAAGVHGMEYPPILALQRLRRAIDPRTLTGTVLMVHVANMPSFLGRTIYYSPVDGQNLNRVFPGRPDGTLSERIADLITREFITRATHVVDLHCGDGNEDLRPYAYWITTGPPAVAAEAREMALAFGLDHIVVDASRPVDPASSLYLSNTATTRGKPALTIESGGLGRTDEASIARIERGVSGLLRHLGMRADGPSPVDHPIWIGRNEVLRAGATGLFHPEVAPGTTVAEGTVIGRITDFHGAELEVVRSPFAGEILYVIGTPPISKGEPVGFVGQVRQDDDHPPLR